MNLQEILGAAGAFVGGAIAAFIEGDDSPPTRRVVEILPAKLRSEVEYARQTKLAREEAERALADRDGEG